MSPVHRAEGVVDADVSKRGQTRRERPVIGDLAILEANILKQQHLARTELLAQPPRALPDDLLAEHNVGVGELTQALRDRSKRTRRIPAARATEMRDDHHPRATATQLLDRQQGRQDPRIAHDLATLQRHVQIGAHQHAPPLHLKIIKRTHAGQSTHAVPPNRRSATLAQCSAPACDYGPEVTAMLIVTVLLPLATDPFTPRL